VLAIVGLSLPVAMARLAPGLAESDAARLVAAYRAAFARLAGGAEAAALSPLYPGVAEGLAEMLARPEPLVGLATGKSRGGLDHVLALHGLTGRFATEQVSDHHPSKPAPAMVLAALDETGVAPADAAMVGDTTHDIEMARAAGVTAFGVSWGYHPADRLRAAGAAAVIDRFADLAPALDELWRQR
jgi:phosphoglycolate phosphatase